MSSFAESPDVTTVRRSTRGFGTGFKDERGEENVHGVRTGGSQLLAAAQRVRGRGYILSGSGKCWWRRGEQRYVVTGAEGEGSRSPNGHR